MEHFVAGVIARTAVELVDVNKNFIVTKYFRFFREIIRSLSDDIAMLIINHHHEKKSEVAKIFSIKLVMTLADAIAQVICKIKERKENRSIDLYSDEEYDQALRLLSEELIHKICNQNDML
ncbi:hypothetical protein KBB68_01020 [Candidatus Babeliales bacterium]|nr:hypothetical protein [Candidatus Babeliales bacterium]